MYLQGTGSCTSYNIPGANGKLANIMVHHTEEEIINKIFNNPQYILNPNEITKCMSHMFLNPVQLICAIADKLFKNCSNISLLRRCDIDEIEIGIKVHVIEIKDRTLSLFETFG